MNWLDALDLADSFWEEATDCNHFCVDSCQTKLDSTLLPYECPLSESKARSVASSASMETASCDDWSLPSIDLGYQSLPKIKSRMRWTAEEDELLENLAEDNWNDWGKIKEHFPNHPLTSVQKRWRKRFDPKVTRTRWTSSEDRLIVQLFEENGGNWVKISKKLPGRLPESIKNRFYGTIRKHLSAEDQERLAHRVRMAKPCENLSVLLSKDGDVDLISDDADHKLSSFSLASPNVKFSTLDKSEQKQKLQELRARMDSLESFLNCTKLQISKIEKEIE